MTPRPTPKHTLGLRVRPGEGDYHTNYLRCEHCGGSTHFPTGSTYPDTCSVCRKPYKTWSELCAEAGIDPTIKRIR